MNFGIRDLYHSMLRSFKSPSVHRKEVDVCIVVLQYTVCEFSWAECHEGCLENRLDVEEVRGEERGRGQRGEERGDIPVNCSIGKVAISSFGMMMSCCIVLILHQKK
jgi:hypothetical protein